MRLYRGLKSSEFKSFDKKLVSWSDITWRRILTKRAKGDFSYPAELSEDISLLEKIIRLRLQHFTDNKEIAETYVRNNAGILVEIEVPTNEIVKYFHIEFQNFGRRKKNFEIVYVIDALTLGKRSRAWKMKLKSPKIRKSQSHE